ncbi:50S ribosomal protein L11 methyltransferase [Acidaminobacterium chupaoyuni]
MNFIEITIETTTAGAEQITERLEDIAGGFVVDDPQDLEDLMNAPSPRWDYIDEKLVVEKKGAVTVRFYLNEDEAGMIAAQEAQARIAQMGREAEASGWGTLRFEKKSVQSEDWENNWKQYYKPFRVGRRLMVRPSWEEVEPIEGCTVLTMDPASSFGTGSHATTRLCLEELESMDCAGRTMLDAGCGSGILAIAGLLLGAERAVCCDVEENAAAATRENLAKNGIAKERTAVYCGDFLSSQATFDAVQGQYDLITANIVADVLIAMAPLLCKWLTKEGDLLLSGIIEERCAEVEAAYQKQQMLFSRESHRDGWVMIHLKHRK